MDGYSYSNLYLQTTCLHICIYNNLYLLLIYFSFILIFSDLHSIRRLLEHDTSASVCPSCRISFDKGKRRKLIDTCGHERCYSCMFRNDQCPMCMNSSLKGKYIHTNICTFIITNLRDIKHLFNERHFKRRVKELMII